MRYLVLLLLFVSLWLSTATAKSCRPYVPYLKKYSQELIRKDFPYWYLVGQDYQESNCRFVISYDGVGSESPAQITWKWWKKYLKPYGIYNLRTIPNFTKAQTLIVRNLVNKAKRKGYAKLWVPFQAYNGGWLVLKELKRAKSDVQYRAFLKCRRRMIHFKNGSSKSACEINYEYPIKIEEHVARYYEDLKRPTPWMMW